MLRPIPTTACRSAGIEVAMHLTLRAGKPRAEGNPGRPANDQRDRGSLSNALDRNRPRIPHGVLVTRGQRRAGLPPPPLRLWQTQVSHQRQARAAPLPPRSTSHREPGSPVPAPGPKLHTPSNCAGARRWASASHPLCGRVPHRPDRAHWRCLTGTSPSATLGSAIRGRGRVCRWRVSRCSSSPAGRSGRVRCVSSRWVRPPPRPLRASPRSRLQPPRPRSRAPG
jgi:hypothetical protein